MQVLGVFVAVWMAAVVVKALRAIRNDEAYVFSMWDGGLLNRGKQLTAFGTRVKVLLGLCLVAASILTVSEQINYRVLMGVAVLGLVADFALTEPSRA